MYWCIPNKVHNSAESDTAWCSDGGGEAGGCLVITNEDPRMAAQAKCSHEEGWVSCVRRGVLWSGEHVTSSHLNLVSTIEHRVSAHLPSSTELYWSYWRCGAFRSEL